MGKEYIIIAERSTGNAEVGRMWHDSLICNESTTLGEIENWVNNRRDGLGRIYLLVSKSVERL